MTPESFISRWSAASASNVPEIQEILETLCTFGRAHPGKEKGTYTT